MASTPSGSTSNMHVPNIELNTDYRSAIRFPAWVALSVFSAVCLAALASEIDSEDRGSEEKFVLAVTSISLIAGIVSVCGYLLARGMLMGTTIELGMIVLVSAMWGVGLPYIMGPDNRIAVIGTQVLNANMYFFSWICLAVCVFLVLSWLQESVGLDARQAPGKQARWFFLLASSLVVMGAAIRILNADSNGCKEEQNSDSKFCKRTRFAISLGVISIVACGAMSFLLFKHLAAATVELGVTTLLLILWTFGVGFITFGGDSSPGTTIGNLYFSTWISFIIGVMLFGNSFQEFAGMKQVQPATSGEEQDDPEVEGNNVPNEEHI